MPVERPMIGDVQISSARCGGTADALKGMFKYECSNISAPPYALLRYFCGYTHTTHIPFFSNTERVFSYSDFLGILQDLGGFFVQ